MKKERNKEAVVSSLRRLAEARLGEEKSENLRPLPVTDVEKLLHELRVHQIELEMQNEELRKAQFEAEQSRAKYADLFDFAPVGYLTLDHNSFITALNITAARLLGVERRLVVNRPFSTFVHGADHHAFYTHWKKVIDSDEKQTCELMLKRKDGTFFHGLLENLPVEAGGIRAIRMTIEDISRQKEVEEELRQAKAELELRVEERAAQLSRAYINLRTETQKRRRLSAAVEQSVEGVLLLGDADLKIEYANPAFLRLSGYALDELVGKDVKILRSGARDDTFYDAIRESVAKGRTWVGDYPLRRKDGSVVLVEKTISPIRDDEGRVVSRVVTSHDVTERRRLESQLRQSQKMEAIGTLAGGIAHDFNNILGAIIGFTEMVMDDIPPDNPMHHRLELVLKSGFRGRDLVRQILTFSRKTSYERAPISLSPLVKETIKLLRASLPATLKIKTHVGAHSDVIIASPSEMQQIIMNLCTNAAHAMGQATGGELTVTLNERKIGPDSTAATHLPPGKYVELAVKDTGTGIDEAVVKRIFEPFFTTKGVGEGTGLGLSVVYGIVKDLKGDITVESVPGAGATFRVLLPAAKTDSPSEEQGDRQVLNGKERILFIDDEELLAELGKDMLEKLGYKVVVMTDGNEAVRFFSDNPSRFDLVLTDMTMPGLTGMEVAKSVLAKRADIPVILCTGHNDEVSTEKAVAAGIRGLLMKPLSRQELASAVRRVLDAKPQA
jgi:PAS domain S-box-containing protein